MLLLIPQDPHQPPWGIVPGSGIVTHDEAAPDARGGHLIYYEGNLNGSEDLRNFWDRVIHAAGRLAKRYPTVACAWVEDWRTGFYLAGRFDYARYLAEARENQSQRGRLGRIPPRSPNGLQTRQGRAFEKSNETFRRLFEPEPGQAARLEAWIAPAKDKPPAR